MKTVLGGFSATATSFGWATLFRDPLRFGFGTLLLCTIYQQLNGPPVQHLGNIAILVVEADGAVDVGQINRINRM